MDPDDPPLPSGGPPPCDCACPCCGPSSSPSPAWRRSLKRSLDRIDAEDEAGRCRSGDALPETEVARVEVENEAAALREALASHQQSVQELYTELEEERSSAATAASEAMSMILRLQREKSEAQMEARQFRRFAEEKMAHDQQELTALEDILFKRDQAVQSLSCEVQAYRHRLASYGILSLGIELQTADSAIACTATPRSFDFPHHEYPPLQCTMPGDIDLTDEATADLEKYAFGETPREHLQNLEQRICQLERLPSSREKGVVGQSPQWPRHLRRLSLDSHSSGWGSLMIREPGQEFNKGEEFPVTVDRTSDHGVRDDLSDRVYTIDAVHGFPVGAGEDYVSTPGELGKKRDAGDMEEGEIKKLYVRLQALEADRESMRQAIISMGTDKSQIVLLREIAQQLCKEVAPERKVIKKPSFTRIFSIMSAIKWITSSFIFWRRKSTRCKYTFGMTSSNAGLLLLLEKSARMRQRRLLIRTQGRVRSTLMSPHELQFRK